MLNEEIIPPDLILDEIPAYRQVEARYAEALAKAYRSNDGIGGLIAELEYFKGLHRLARLGAPVAHRIALQAPHAARARKILFETETIIREVREGYDNETHCLLEVCHAE